MKKVILLILLMPSLGAAQWTDYNQETGLLGVSYDAAEGASYYVISINEREFQVYRRIGMTMNTSVSGIPITSGVLVVAVKVDAYAANGSLIGTTHDGTWGGEWEPPPFQTEGYYGDYRVFANTHFGADKDGLYYDHFGEDLFFLHNATYIDDWQYDEDSFWLYESVNSAAIAFSTSLPSHAWVEYGLTTGYGASTDTTDARYFVHLRHVNGLEPNNQYHYRIHAVDVRDIEITATGTFTTDVMGSKIEVPGALSGPPYRLNTAGGHYVLTDDISADARAVSIEANNITVDLNGHTIVYDNVYNETFANASVATWNGSNDAPAGVGNGAWQGDGATIFNGIILQGAGGTPGSHAETHGPNPIYNSRVDGTVKGIKAEWHSHHTGGIANQSSGFTVMYCDVADLGYSVGNRQSPAPAIGRFGGGADHQGIEARYNIVRRTRQTGIAEVGGSRSGVAGEGRGNEIHIDSWCTNSTGITPWQYGRVLRNRVFGTGYHATGLNWGWWDTVAPDSTVYRHNFVHLQGDEPSDRDDEYGIESSVIGFRFTQYGGQTYLKENYLLEHNTFLVFGMNGTNIVRGIQLTTDPAVPNLIFRNNVVKHGFSDASTPGGLAAAIVTNYFYNAGDILPVYVYDNTISSNIGLFRFDESYGAASENLRVYDNNISRYGDREDFVTIRAGYWDRNTTLHRLIDNTMTGGASVGDAVWVGTGTRWYWVGTSLYVEARNGSDDSLIASTELTVTSTATGHSDSNFSDGFDTDASGLARLHLIETTYIPTGSAAHTGHTITIPGFAPALVDTIAGFDWNALPNTVTPLTVYFTPEPD